MTHPEHDCHNVSILSFPTIAAVVVAGADGKPMVPYPVEQLLPAAARAGFRAVGLDWFTVRDAESRGFDVQRLAELAAELGLVWTDLAALGLTADETRDVPVSRSMARRCRVLGIPVCGLVISLPPSSQIYSRVATCAEVFAESGTRLALEFLPYSGVKTLDQARDVCEHVGYDACGLLIDSLHMVRSGATPAGIAELSGSDIACVQLADGPVCAPEDLVEESRNGRLLPGAGDFDLAGFAAALDSVGYTGPISLEVLSSDLRRLKPDELAQAYFAAGIAYADQHPSDS